MAPTTRRTTSSSTLRAARPARTSTPAPKPANDAHDNSTGKTSAELKVLVEEARGEARMLEKMASSSALGEVTRQAARAAFARVTELQLAVELAEQAEFAAAAAAARKATNKNTVASRKSREKKRVEADASRQLEAQAARELRGHTKRRKLTADDLSEEDGQEAKETYPGADTERKLERIMQLVREFGVITSGTVIKYVKNLDGSNWGGNPVRIQLTKLMKRGDLVERFYTGPRPTKQGFVGRGVRLYALTEADIDAQIAEWRNAAVGSYAARA